MQLGRHNVVGQLPQNQAKLLLLDIFGIIEDHDLGGDGKRDVRVRESRLNLKKGAWPTTWPNLQALPETLKLWALIVDLKHAQAINFIQATARPSMAYMLRRTPPRLQLAAGLP